MSRLFLGLLAIAFGLCPQARAQRYGFTIAVTGGLVPILHVRTNLPDGTRFVGGLLPLKEPDAPLRLLRGLSACIPDCVTVFPEVAETHAIVRQGSFDLGPFTISHGKALRPGLYQLLLSLDLTDAPQPQLITLPEMDVRIGR